MDYHIKIKANILIKRVIDHSDSSSSSDTSESMIIETSSSSSSSSSDDSIAMDCDQESFKASTSSESMITDDDDFGDADTSNESFYTALSRAPIIIIPNDSQEINSSSSENTSITSNSTSSVINKSYKRISNSKRAGLIFPVKRVYKKLKTFGKRVMLNSCIEMAAILEYLVADLLDLSGEVTFSLDKSMILPRHIYLAIQKDKELKALLDHVTLPDSGVTEAFVQKHKKDFK